MISPFVPLPHSSTPFPQPCANLHSRFRVSGYQIQLSIETAVLTSLSKSLRQGRYTAPAIGAPTSLILIGHSFGSATSNAALVQIPSLVDAAILTGFGLNGSTSASVFLGVQPRIARLQRPHAFAAFDAAYLTTVDVFSTITTFFKAPDYDRAIARRAEATKQPFSLFEFLTFGGTVAPEYGGPVLVISGEFDFPICGGLCTGVLDDGLRAILPNAKVLESYVQPGAGHATNLALNATDFYAKIFSFLKRQGL